MSEAPQEIERDIRGARRALGETLHELERRLSSPRELMEQAMETVRGSFDGQSRMGEAVRDNGIPLALVGIGLGWLMVSGAMRWRGQEGLQREQGEWQTGRYAGYGAEPGYGAYGETGYGAAEYPTATTEAGRGKTREAAGRMSEMTRQAQEKAGQVTETARRRMSEVGESVARMGRSWREQSGQLGERSMQTFQDHPFVVGSMALLIGAALGASLPRTRREDEWLGERRDEFMEGARDAGQREWEKAKRVASRTAEVAREQAGEAWDRVKETAAEEAERQRLAGTEGTSRLQH